MNSYIFQSFCIVEDREMKENEPIWLMFVELNGGLKFMTVCALVSYEKKSERINEHVSERC